MFADTKKVNTLVKNRGCLQTKGANIENKIK